MKSEQVTAGKSDPRPDPPLTVTQWNDKIVSIKIIFSSIASMVLIRIFSIRKNQDQKIENFGK